MKYDLIDLPAGSSRSPTGAPYWQDPREALAYLLAWHVPARPREEFRILDETGAEWREDGLPSREEAGPGGGEPEDGRAKVRVRSRLRTLQFRFLKRRKVTPLSRVLYVAILLGLVLLPFVDAQSEAFRLLFLAVCGAVAGLGLLTLYDEVSHKVVNRQRMQTGKALFAAACVLGFLWLMAHTLRAS